MDNAWTAALKTATNATGGSVRSFPAIPANF